MTPSLGVLLLAVVLLVGLELVLPSRSHWPPGASAAFGLVGCAVIVGIAKGLAGLGFQRTDASDE